MAEVTIRISDRSLRVARILFAGALLVGVFYYLWSSGIFIPKYQLSLYVPDAAGLAVHAPVRLDGIQVGSLSAIKLAGASASPQRRIELVLQVYKRDQDAIRSDSNASLTTEGFLGNRYVSISRGFKGTVIAPGGEIPSKPSLLVTLKDSMHFFDKTLDCLQQEKNSVDNNTPGSTGPAPKSHP